MQNFEFKKQKTEIFQCFFVPSSPTKAGLFYLTSSKTCWSIIKNQVIYCLSNIFQRFLQGLPTAKTPGLSLVPNFGSKKPSSIDLRTPSRSMTKPKTRPKPRFSQDQSCMWSQDGRWGVVIPSLGIPENVCVCVYNYIHIGLYRYILVW